MDQPHADTLPRFFSKADFLAWEEEQEARFEFDGEDVFEVNGGSLRHIMIIRNLTTELQQRLRGSPFTVLPQVKIETGPGYRYPDVSIGPRVNDGTKTVFPAPVVVFEVLSPSTSRIDLGRKRAEYGNIDSIQRYVVLESTRVAARTLGADGRDVLFEGLDAVIDLTEILVGLPLRACYEDVSFG